MKTMLTTKWILAFVLAVACRSALAHGELVQQQPNLEPRHSIWFQPTETAGCFTVGAVGFQGKGYFACGRVGGSLVLPQLELGIDVYASITRREQGDQTAANVSIGVGPIFRSSRRPLHGFYIQPKVIVGMTGIAGMNFYLVDGSRTVNEWIISPELMLGVNVGWEYRRQSWLVGVSMGVSAGGAIAATSEIGQTGSLFAGLSQSVHNSLAWAVEVPHLRVGYAF